MIGFVPALLNPSAEVPDGLTDGTGHKAGRRFDVYRNNVTVGLTDALAAGFPVIQKLVGEAFFRAMAVEFLRAHPPAMPVLTFWGEDFPGFLHSFKPVAHLPYLADVARLEYALREAYHAADATPVAPDALATPDLVSARLRLAPATRLVASRFPIHAIWRFNTDPTAPPVSGSAQTVLVARPDWDPWPRLIAPDAALFIAALLAGESFGTAAEAAGESHDLAATLTLLLDTKSIIVVEVSA